MLLYVTFVSSIPREHNHTSRLSRIDTTLTKQVEIKKGMGDSNFSLIPVFRPSHCPQSRISNAEAHAT